MTTSENKRITLSIQKWYFVNFFLEKINDRNNEFNIISSKIFMDYIIKVHENFKYPIKQKNKQEQQRQQQQQQEQEQERIKRIERIETINIQIYDNSKGSVKDWERLLNITSENRYGDITWKSKIIWVKELNNLNTDHLAVFIFNSHSTNIDIWMDEFKKIRTNYDKFVYKTGSRYIITYTTEDNVSNFNTIQLDPLAKKGGPKVFIVNFNNIHIYDTTFNKLASTKFIENFILIYGFSPYFHEQQLQPQQKKESQQQRRREHQQQQRRRQQEQKQRQQQY